MWVYIYIYARFSYIALWAIVAVLSIDFVGARITKTKLYNVEFEAVQWFRREDKEVRIEHSRFEGNSANSNFSKAQMASVEEIAVSSNTKAALVQ